MHLSCSVSMEVKKSSHLHALRQKQSSKTVRIKLLFNGGYTVSVVYLSSDIKESIIYSLSMDLFLKKKPSLISPVRHWKIHSVLVLSYVMIIASRHCDFESFSTISNQYSELERQSLSYQLVDHHFQQILLICQMLQDHSGQKRPMVYIMVGIFMSTKERLCGL